MVSQAPAPQTTAPVSQTETTTDTATTALETGLAVLDMPTAPKPATAAPVTPVTPATPVVQAQPSQPVTQPVATPQPAAQTPLSDVTPQNDDPDSAAPVISRRPPTDVPDRPTAPPPPPAKPKATAETKPKPKAPAQSARQGSNAPVNANKGTATGSDQGRAAKAATSQSKNSQAGNAAMNNYNGKVYRKIARARRGTANAPGKALVALRIAPSGQLVSASIARSSGSAQFDQIAVAQVRRAAPFPAVPTGKQLNLTLTITPRN